MQQEHNQILDTMDYDRTFKRIFDADIYPDRVRTLFHLIFGTEEMIGNFRQKRRRFYCSGFRSTLLIGFFFNIALIGERRKLTEILGMLKDIIWLCMIADVNNPSVKNIMKKNRANDCAAIGQ